jgi:hypothetical protein
MTSMPGTSREAPLGQRRGGRGPRADVELTTPQ